MGGVTTITIEGGFNAAYSVNSGCTLILEPATLAGGTVSFDNVGARRLYTFRRNSTIIFQQSHIPARYAGQVTRIKKTAPETCFPEPFR